MKRHKQKKVAMHHPTSFIPPSAPQCLECSSPTLVPLHSHGGRPTPRRHPARNSQAQAADIDLTINGHLMLGASTADAEQDRRTV